MCVMKMLLMVVTIVLPGITSSSPSVSIEEKMRGDADLSQFYSMLQRNEIANVSLRLKKVTIFAPTNEAFQRYTPQSFDAELDKELVLYHMTNLPQTTQQFVSGSSTSLTSELEGNPRLWVTTKKGPYHDDVYINNARLLFSQSNYMAKNSKNMDQVLHKIDEVLIPVMSSSTAAKPMYNPNAWEFLENYESLNINPFRIRVFRDRIGRTKKEDIFRNEGGHTFFIPVDDGFKSPNSHAESSIDAKVIDGHVIPKMVLFTAPTGKDLPYQTLADGDNMKVYITFSEETHGRTTTIYIKSHNILGDNTHSKGVVLAEIVKANIPVKNGVVHLINKPLMVVDKTVKDFLMEKDDGPLSKFCQEIADAGDVGKEFMRTIERAHDSITLFAPSNSAWDDGNLKNLLRDPNSMKEILNMHLVLDKRLFLENIADAHKRHATTLNPKKTLIFNVAMIGPNRTLTVDGGGVNATVIQPDIAAKNGVIHIIDRVLGVPYTTIIDKLRNDAQLNDTLFLGSRSGFNQQLNDTTRKYTFFVPRDKAWADARIRFPSEIKKLFMPDYSYHVTQLLERHLVISDIAYTMEQIKVATGDTNNTPFNYYKHKEVELPTVRDSLSLFVEERQDHSFIIHWKGEKIPVFRPNIECTNGIIHVIDAPFLKEGDIRVSGASITKMAPHILMLVAAKWLLL